MILAWLAAICFLASLLGVTLGTVNLGGYVATRIHLGPRS